MIIGILLGLLLIEPGDAPESGAISGMVIDYVTAAPVGKARVCTETLWQGTRVCTETDENGQFHLLDLKPATYQLTASRNRYLNTFYGTRWGGEGISFAVHAGQTITDVRLRIIPLAVIAGTIRDSDGEPLARVPVTALHEKFDGGHRSVSAAGETLTDDFGHYRLTEVSPGDYYVRADPAAREPGNIDTGTSLDFDAMPSLASALSPGVRERRAARLVHVEAGDRVEGIDILLSHQHTVSVKGKVALPGGAPLLGVNLDGWVTAALGEQFLAEVHEKGEFEFPAVPPGSYVLSACAGSDEHILRGEMSLEVKDKPIEELVIPVSLETQVNLQIAYEGGAGESSAGAMVRFENERGESMGDPLQPKINLPAGHYMVYPVAVQADANPIWNTSKITVDGRDVLVDGITIPAAATVSVDIVFSANGAALAGTVSNGDHKPVAGATVVLIPNQPLRRRTDRYYHTKSDPYGRFTLNNIAPGDYRTFAWDDVEPGIWHDPAFIQSVESKGEPITLKSGGRESLQLRLQ
jgi:hypothetical protein